MAFLPNWWIKLILLKEVVRKILLQLRNVKRLLVLPYLILWVQILIMMLELLSWQQMFMVKKSNMKSQDMVMNITLIKSQTILMMVRKQLYLIKLLILLEIRHFRFLILMMQMNGLTAKILQNLLRYKNFLLL